MKKLALLLFSLAASLGAPAATNNVAAGHQRAVIVDSLDIAPVWAGHPVGFALLTHAPDQFVAYYDDHRQLTVAQRRLDEHKWTFTQLPDTTGWDSHNYIALAADKDGFLHLSADMHVVPLKYFRTRKPWDATSFEALNKMVGTNETRCTYPIFLRDTNNDLIFTYRDGRSGSGNQLYNIYDTRTKTWRRFLDTPLTDGENKNNAYFVGPVRGPDGWYHLTWIWRASPDAATCHDLSYARSRDLKHWETGSGRQLSLPIRLSDAEIVDPVPQHGGMINGNTVIGFDANGRVTISYHKYDAAGNLQPWTARLEDGIWKLYQITDWPYRLEFSGGGSLPSFGIHLGAVHLESDGRLTQTFSHVKFGGGTWLLDPQTLRTLGTARGEQRTPSELGRVQGTFPGLSAKWAEDIGTDDQPDQRFILRWETLNANRDRPRQGPLPPPSMLRVYEIKSAAANKP